MPVTQSTSFVAQRSGSNLTSPTTTNNSVAGFHNQHQFQHHQNLQQQQQLQEQKQHQKQQQPSVTPTSPDFLTPTSSVSSLSSPSASSPFRRTYFNQPPLPTTPKTARSTASVSAPSVVPVLHWKEPEIAGFLHSIKCGHLVRTFEAHDITGSVILELVDVALLKEMGIDRVGDRVRLISGLKALKASIAAANATSVGGTARPSRQGSADGGSSVSAGQEAYRVGPRVIVTRGEELSAHGRVSPVFPPPQSPSYVHHQSGSAQTYALLGRRPAPLDIAPLGQHVTDLRSAQPHQYSPNASTASSVSQAVSRKHSKESFLHSSASQTNLDRPHQSLPAPPDPLQIVPPPPQQLLPPPPIQPQLSSFSASPYDLSSLSTTNYPDKSSRVIAANLSGGSFTERRAHLARERQTDLSVTSTSSSAPYSSSASSSNRPSFPSHSNEKQPAGNRGLNGRSVPLGGGSSHPFATAPATPSSPTYPPLSSSNSSHPQSGMSTSSSLASLSSQTGRATSPPLHVPASGSGSGSGLGSSVLNVVKSFPGSVPLALEDLRRKCFKFTNAEDGGTRVVNIGDLTDGMEVMEKALKKFGKWRDGGAKGVKGVEYLESSDEGETERETDERRVVGPGGGKEESGLVVDGWGIFLKDYGGEVDTYKPLTAKELVQVCQVPFDSPTRQSGLILKRIRKLHNRKAMEAFFGEIPPVPDSPSSPDHANKHARHPVDHRDSSAFYSGTSGSGLTRSSSKKMNRASTISVMSGLGVPLGPQIESSTEMSSREHPQRAALLPVAANSTTTSAEQGASTPPPVKSPSTTSFLGNRGRKMYNFFGHRPPSELISNHLADYFPKVQKKVLERTARNSMMRVTSGPSGSSAPGSLLPDGGASRLSWEETKSRDPRASGLGYGNLSRERQASHSGKSVRSFVTTSSKGGITSSEDVSEEPLVTSSSGSYTTREQSFDVPRLSISTDGSVSERASMISIPPYLPDFIPSGESFSDSLAVYSPSFGGFSFDSSPAGAGAKGRRSSFGSSSRMSLLSQFRRKRDTSDTASMRTVDEITAHVESKRASTISDPWKISGDGRSNSGDEQEDEDREEQVVDEHENEEGDSMRGFRRTRDSDSIRFSRTLTKRSSSFREKEQESSLSMGNEDGIESEEGEEEYEEEISDEVYTEDESDEEEYDHEDEEEEEEDVVSVEDEHGKAFMSEGNKRSFKWIKGALIGSGSFGSVFLGMAASTGLLMAVKQVDIPTGQSVNEEKKKLMLSALETEIELLKELQHDNIVQYLDSSMDAAHLNIFLEYVPGGSVTALLGNYGAFEEALVRIFVRQTLQGLVYLHEKGIIHRDIKGANILVDNKGGIKISDFGISKRVETDLLAGVNQRRSLQGTVFWMAPEVVRQTAHTPKADIWSVGCLVVEMLTGQRPWGHLDQMQVMFKIGGSARPEYPPDITSEAEDFLNKTFIFDYNDRLSASDCLVHPFIVEPLE